MKMEVFKNQIFQIKCILHIYLLSVLIIITVTLHLLSEQKQ